jgi:hypothetical protein
MSLQSSSAQISTSVPAVNQFSSPQDTILAVLSCVSCLTLETVLQISEGQRKSQPKTHVEAVLSFCYCRTETARSLIMMDYTEMRVWVHAGL